MFKRWRDRAKRKGIKFSVLTVNESEVKILGLFKIKRRKKRRKKG